MIRYFISDLHLSDKRPDLIRAFVQMMDELIAKHPKNDAALYILGDFYEAWIGDDDQPAWNLPIEASLKKLSDSGMGLFFLHGNRDFLIGDAWCQRVGATLLDEQTLITTSEFSVLLTHGDEYCQEDVEYQTFRRMVRNPQWQQQILSMPLEKRIALAAQLRDDSKSMSAQKSQGIMDVTERCVQDSLADNHSQVVIHGHTHRPAFHIHQQYARCVLGDWDKQVWLAYLDDQELYQSGCDTATFLAQGLSGLAPAQRLKLPL
ncbi:UDP-2,3-diacylglucosamine diphosphatase [Marinomonas pollencensis]|uniref:UDP-2,3-diacylglucosamine hydrolase n=1 Tax=Marinomonas pollencensis TaxID=491954 RepID=A0A3E0DTI5_9GAMM|nr:UDP-2,3-diacylglucosamine diphosphatase [Marinomonas pollencensis]REG85816.1 UDP-2,3-diacylglucosamine hydrolase [Marinomonas pollencensis]